MASLRAIIDDAVSTAVVFRALRPPTKNLRFQRGTPGQTHVDGRQGNKPLCVSRLPGKMIPGYSPTVQGLLGTLFTWFLTAVGAAAVFVLPRTLSRAREEKIMDASLGFASGVMLAASYWSLLAPAIEMSDSYGAYSFLPATVGFMLGGGFVSGADYFMPVSSAGGLGCGRNK